MSAKNFKCNFVSRRRKFVTVCNQQEMHRWNDERKALQVGIAE